MNKQKSEYRIGVGASSILMVLVVLALTALGLLSFGGARNAETLANRSMQMSTGYHQAAATAQRQLAIMDDALQRTMGELDVESAANFCEEMQKKGLVGFSLNEEADMLLFSFHVNALYDRELQLAGRILPQVGTRYQLTRHELVSLQPEDDEPHFFLMGD